jgi:hypothetical protein
MRRTVLLTVPLVLAATLFGLSCFRTSDPPTASHASGPPPSPAPSALVPIRGVGAFALPDRGDLLRYSAQPVRHENASTWYPADISESHALRAVVTGHMTITAPDGLPIRLQYQRHIEHSNGNWTWIGRDAYGEDAVLTFGEKAVFGSIPQHDREELRLSTRGGRAWVVQIDPVRLHSPEASKPDFLVPPSLAASLASSESVAASAQPEAVAATAAATVDIALGYTTAYAAELGGDSQAVTRLQNLVDITNQAYVNSQINAQVRLVRTLSVAYADATDNGDALSKLSGYKTGTGTMPTDPAFAGLRAARDQYGADLVSLVRRFRTPENDGCGIAWLIGGDKSPIDNSDARFGYSVVSDDLDMGDYDESDGKTYGCRKESLAHEFGHNMGQAHNIEDSTEPGAHAYSYGYRETSTSGFYTVMAYRLPNSAQRGIRYFANPNVTDSGTGRPTGVANASDNARSMAQTMPLIAAFRATAVPAASTPDLYLIAKQGASGTTEVHVLGQQSGYQSFLLHQASGLHVTGSDYAWRFQLADYNGDGILDLYVIYRMGASGTTEVHVLNGADRFQTFLLHTATALHITGTDNGWIFRVGDYNRDGRPDVYAITRNGASGHTEVHVLDGATNFASFLAHFAMPLPATGTDGSWNFLLGDYNRDGILDLYIVFKNATGSGMTEVHVADGATQFNTYHLHAATALHLTGSNNAWDFKLGDYNGDGVLDVFAISKQGASLRTEVHVLDGASGFGIFTAHIATALHSTGSDDAWEFELGTYR